MASLPFPEPLKLEELKDKAVAMSRESREFSAPLPVFIPMPAEGVDPDAEDPIASQVFSGLFNSDKYSDLTIRCQDRVWRAHKAVVCAQSKVLAACVDGPFKESKTGVIDLSEDEPEVIEHMLNYMYKGFYDFQTPTSSIEYKPDSTSTKQEWISWIWRTETNGSLNCPPAASPDVTPSYATPQPSRISTSSAPNIQLQTHGRVAPIPSRLITHASVYCIAEQYDLPRLKNYALCKYAGLAPSAWKSPFFIPSLKLIYDRTPSRTPMIDDLRAIAAKTAAEHSQYFLDRTDFLEACTENGEMATDVLRMTLVIRQMELKVDWKPKVWCAVDPKHDLVYIPQLAGFGMGQMGFNGMSTMAMQGFGSKTGGKFKCVHCGHIVK